MPELELLGFPPIHQIKFDSADEAIQYLLRMSGTIIPDHTTRAWHPKFWQILLPCETRFQIIKFVYRITRLIKRCPMFLQSDCHRMGSCALFHLMDTFYQFENFMGLIPRYFHGDWTHIQPFDSMVRSNSRLNDSSLVW